jgi:hypothetical protein
MNYVQGDPSKQNHFLQYTVLYLYCFQINVRNFRGLPYTFSANKRKIRGKTDENFGLKTHISTLSTLIPQAAVASSNTL